MEILAIIPARSGSKGLPEKNVKLFANHPLIAYSIKAAQLSNMITRIVVNTDSHQIADIGKTYGAEIPFIRCAELAQDNSTDYDVFYHALTWFAENENYYPDYIIQLRPTSPLRTHGLIDACIEKLVRSNADSLRVVTKSPLTPYKMWFIENEFIKPVLCLENIKEPYNQPRQLLPEAYWQTGTLDVVKASVITEQKSMSGKKVIPYIIDNSLAVDIDNEESFLKAEQIIKNLNCIKF